MPSDTGDARLRERLIQGDDDALAEIYDSWSTLVFTVAIRIIADRAAAEDVTQDVFVQLWERPEAYDAERGTLRTWLCIKARSRALDWIRRNQTRDRYQAAASAIVDGQADVDEAVMWRTETEAVRQAVRALPEPQRNAVFLAFYEHRTYREVARELEIPEGTAKSRLRLGLASLSSRLAAEGIIE